MVKLDLVQQGRPLPSKAAGILKGQLALPGYGLSDFTLGKMKEGTITSGSVRRVCQPGRQAVIFDNAFWN